jgi:hypothetical protein
LGLIELTLLLKPKTLAVTIMSDNAHTAKHDAIKDHQSSNTAANDCHAFAAELAQINRHEYLSIEAEAHLGLILQF